MAEHPRLMLYRVIGSRLNGATDAGTSVYTTKVPANKARPYILITVPSMQERNFHIRQGDPTTLVQIKAVATSERVALTVCQQAIELLDDQGEQDLGGLVGGADWHVLKAMVENRMTPAPYTQGNSEIYEDMFQLRVILQER